MKTWQDIQNDKSFWSPFMEPGRNVLMLDYDGTLAPFRTDPGEAVPYQGVRDILEHLATKGGCRLVFVTGRPVRNLASLLGLSVPPEIWGSHGAERLYPDGRLDPVRMRPVQDAGFHETDRIVQAAGFADRLEIKPGCRAVHWRGVEEARRERILDELRPALERVAADHDLKVHPFDGGMEIRIPGLDKGRCVRMIRSEEGEGARVVFLGDDLTDEDAFSELAGKNGTGILVRSVLRPTRARIWLRPPDELILFLRSWACHCRSHPC